MIDKYTDNVIARTIMPFIPQSVSPNQITYLRLLLLPFVFYALFTQHYLIGFIIFVIAALTDALDGAIARKRNQITDLGKTLDPIADRALIGLVAIMVLPIYFGWWIVGALFALETFNAILAYRSNKKSGVNHGANWAGKIKMIIQCIAFCAVLIRLFSGAGWLIPLAYLLILVSFLFNIVQAFAYP